MVSVSLGHTPPPDNQLECIAELVKEKKIKGIAQDGSREVAANDKILMRIVLVVLGCSPVIFH